jgi:hypothetical protein
VKNHVSNPYKNCHTSAFIDIRWEDKGFESNGSKHSPNLLLMTLYMHFWSVSVPKYFNFDVPSEALLEVDKYTCIVDEWLKAVVYHRTEA